MLQSRTICYEVYKRQRQHADVCRPAVGEQHIIYKNNPETPVSARLMPTVYTDVSGITSRATPLSGHVTPHPY